MRALGLSLLEALFFKARAGTDRALGKTAPRRYAIATRIEARSIHRVSTRGAWEIDSAPIVADGGRLG